MPSASPDLSRYEKDRTPLSRPGQKLVTSI
jgi:hypothetical protein